MAIELTNIKVMPESDIERARKLDARTFSNQPNRNLTAEAIKQKLAIPTEILILESNRLVNEINATINQVESNLNTINETATDFRSTYDQEVSSINSFTDELNYRLKVVENDLNKDNINGVRTELKKYTDNKISVTNQNVSALSTTVSNNKTAIETRVQDLQDSLDTDIANLDDYAKITLKNRIDELVANLTALSNRHEQDKGAHQTDYENLLARVNAILESSTEDLDSFKEVVDMVKNADDTIIETLSRKVNKSDIVNDFESTSTNQPLSANGGRILNANLNTLNGRIEYVKEYIDTYFNALDAEVVKDDRGVVLKLTFLNPPLHIEGTNVDGTVGIQIQYKGEW